MTLNLDRPNRSGEIAFPGGGCSGSRYEADEDDGRLNLGRWPAVDVPDGAVERCVGDGDPGSAVVF